MKNIQCRFVMLHYSLFQRGQGEMSLEKCITIRHWKNILYLLIPFLVSCSSDQSKRDDFFNRGNQFLGQGDFTLAIEHYSNALEVDPEFDLALNNRGVAQVESEHPHEAIIDYNLALLINPKYDECRLNRAYAYERIGQFKNAFRDIDYLTNQSPDSAYLHFYKGLVLSKMRDFETSLISFQRAVELGNETAEVWVNIATTHFFIGWLDSAKYFLDKALVLDPNQPNAYNTMSHVLLMQNDLTGAMYAVERALELTPNEPYFINNRGMVYLEMDSLELGLTDINKSILLNPKNGWAYKNKGIYYSRKGEYDRALEMFERAKTGNEFVDELYYYLGKTYLEMGKGDKACETWTEGLAKGDRRCEVMAIACGI